MLSPIVGRRIISNIAVPTRKGTRSNPAKPIRAVKPVEKYVAKPACLTDRTCQRSSWSKSENSMHGLQVQNKTLQDQTSALQVELLYSHTKMLELNKALLAKDQMGDSRPMSHSPPEPHEPFDCCDMITGCN